MLVLCPTRCSNSDVHLTVGYLLPKPLNSSEAEGCLIIRNLLPLMCGCFCLWYFPSSINQNKVVLLKDLATEHITVNYLMAISIFPLLKEYHFVKPGTIQ